jgi:hypothetical protein
MSIRGARRKRVTLASPSVHLPDGVTACSSGGFCRFATSALHLDGAATPQLSFATNLGDRADNPPSVHSPHLTTPPSRRRSMRV